MTRKQRRAVTAVVVGVVTLGMGVGVWSYRPAVAQYGGTTSVVPPTRTPATAREVEEGKPAPRPGEPARPIGTWEREFGRYRITLRIEGDRIFGTCAITDPDLSKSGKVSICVDGDYSVTRDGVLHGVVTSVDMELPPELSQERMRIDLGAAADYKSYFDQPYCFRFRLDGDVLSIRDVKYMTGKKDGDDVAVLLMGRYKRKVAPGKEPAVTY